MITITLTTEQAYQMIAAPMIAKFERLLELEAMLVQQPGSPMLPEALPEVGAPERGMPRRYQYPVTWNL